MPRSPILADAIRTALRKIQQRADLVAGVGVLSLGGPGVLGRAVKKVGGTQDGIRFGVYQLHWGMRFLYDDKVIILHKCDQCGKNQTWDGGNDYSKKLEMGEYFCPDATSLFWVNKSAV